VILGSWQDRDEGEAMTLSLITWWRERKQERESRDAFASAADEELYALLDEASNVSAG
jgi:hypothetical protein